MFRELAATLKEDIVNAAKKTGETGAGYGAASEETLPLTVGKVINALLSIIGILLVALMVYAGYLWMTAQGDEEQVQKAQRILRESVIGLAIILLAYAATRFVVARLVNAVTN